MVSAMEITLANLIKNRIAECQGKDPETMRHLKSAQEKLELYEKAMAGDADALMLFSLKTGMITQEQYQDFIRTGNTYCD